MKIYKCKNGPGLKILTNNSSKYSPIFPLSFSRVDGESRNKIHNMSIHQYELIFKAVCLIYFLESSTAIAYQVFSIARRRSRQSVISGSAVLSHPLVFTRHRNIRQTWTAEYEKTHIRLGTFSWNVTAPCDSNCCCLGDQVEIKGI